MPASRWRGRSLAPRGGSWSRVSAQVPSRPLLGPSRCGGPRLSSLPLRPALRRSPDSKPIGGSPAAGRGQLLPATGALLPGRSWVRPSCVLGGGCPPHRAAAGAQQDSAGAGGKLARKQAGGAFCGTALLLSHNVLLCMCQVSCFSSLCGRMTGRQQNV